MNELKFLLTPICWLKTVWATILYSNYPFGPYISGHDFVEQEDGSLVCEVCGKKSV